MIVYESSIPAPLKWIYIAIGILSVIYFVLGWFAVKQLNSKRFEYIDFVMYSVGICVLIYVVFSALAFFRII